VRKKHYLNKIQPERPNFNRKPEDIRFFSEKRPLPRRDAVGVRPSWTPRLVTYDRVPEKNMQEKREKAPKSY